METHSEPTQTIVSRRDFITKVGVGLASIPLAGVYAHAAMSESPKWPTPGKSPDSSAGKQVETPALESKIEQAQTPRPAFLPKSERIGFAIVGLGKLAIEEILPAMHDSHLCKVVALVSGHRDKAQKIAAQYEVAEKNIYSYENFDEIANNPEIQVVYIVLPNALHKEFVIRSAKAKKHVLCEKPMATSAKEAREMVSACKTANVKLMIAYRQQYEPNNRFIQSLVREKTFGKTKLFEANNSQDQAGVKGGTQQWRHIRALAGGGALPDIGLYCLNGVRFLTGEEPYEVFAYAYSTPDDPRFKEIEETICFTLKFPSGLIALCTASYGSHQTKRYRITAENGWFGMEPAFAYHGLKTEVSYALGSPYEHHETPTMAERNQFSLEMDHFADCVLHNKLPHTPGEEGVQDHIIMDAIYESAKIGKPVSLARIEKLDSFRNEF